jgi:tripartite-type tricarboxylate transporter receptor subunit TctC
MTISRRTLIATLGAFPAAALFPRIAFAAYPDHPIRLIVPFAPGGNADIVGRLVGNEIAAELKQTVVIENRAGAGGGIGAQAVAKSEPDGYTLLLGSNGPLTINPLMNASLGYDPIADFVPVALTSYVPHSLILANQVPAKTLDELVALSKKGKSLNIGTSGVGSATHMTLERFKAATGANITHVPYKGGGDLVPGLVGGTLDGAMTEFSTALELHKSKQAYIVATGSAKRSQLAPDIATFIEGGLKDFTAASYIGVLAPAKTPPAVVAQLQKAIADSLKSGPAVERLISLGSEIATPEQMTSQGFAAYIKVDAENMRQAAKLADIKPQ